MGLEKDNIQGLIFNFFCTPLFVGMSIRILNRGYFTHIATGHKYVGIELYGFAIPVILISFFFNYTLLFKIPKLNYGIENVKRIWHKLLSSPFLYIFIITIFCPAILDLFNLGHEKIFIILSMLILCFIVQLQYFRDIKKYII